MVNALVLRFASGVSISPRTAYAMGFVLVLFIAHGQLDYFDDQSRRPLEFEHFVDFFKVTIVENAGRIPEK